MTGRSAYPFAASLYTQLGGFEGIADRAHTADFKS